MKSRPKLLGQKHEIIKPVFSFKKSLKIKFISSTITISSLGSSVLLKLEYGPPFSHASTSYISGVHAYKTGDILFWLSNGKLKSYTLVKKKWLLASFDQKCLQFTNPWMSQTQIYIQKFLWFETKT